VQRYAESLFSEHRIFCSDLLSDRDEEGVCRFACPGSFGMLFNKFLIDYAKRHRRLQCELAFAPNTTVYEQVKRQSIDAGFVNFKIKDKGLRFQRIGDEKLVLLVPASHVGEDLAALDKLGLINHPDAIHLVPRFLEKAKMSSGVVFEDLKISGFSNQIALIPEWVSAGLGYTVLPEYAVVTNKSLKKLRIVASRHDTSDPLYLVEDQNRRRPARIAKLVDEFLGSYFIQYNSQK
jgi:DNA-binding transcriptional LysR family regulator